MFKQGKHRYLRSDIFKMYRFMALPSDTFRVLLSLRSYADDVGNVDLTMNEFVAVCPLMIPPPSPDWLDERVEELIDAGLLHAYMAKGRRYASIDGFNDPAAPLYSPGPRSKKDETKWRNPTPDQADKEPHVPVRSDNSVRDISKRYKGGGERGSRTSGELSGQLDDARVSARSERGTARPSGRDERNQGPEARKKVGHRPGSRRKPQEAQDEVTPSPTKQKLLMKPLRPSQPATEASPKKRPGRPPQKLRESATKERHTSKKEVDYEKWRKEKLSKLQASLKELNRTTGGKHSGSSTTGTTTSTSRCETCWRISCTCTKSMPTRFEARFNR